MSEQLDAHAPEPLRARLERLGDARDTRNWDTGEVDYVARLGLTPGDVPELVAIAREWAEPEDWPEDKDYVAAFAPVHAWRGLAQLEATQALAPLLEMMDRLDEVRDDWYLDEFPHVFAWVGPACLPALGDYLADAGHSMYPRSVAGDGLKELAKRHPETREEAVQALCRTLSHFQETDTTLNGFIVADLLDLKATEAAELMERAYAADRVMIGICGNWNMVREELGVAGLGIVPEELAGMEWRWVREGQANPEDEEVPSHGGRRGSPAGRIESVPVLSRSSPKVGRNDPCPCGSGKKHKKCCGR